MIALYILLSLVLLIFLILFLNVHLIFDFHEKLTITLKVLWFRFDGYELIKKIGEEDTNTSQKSTKAKKKTGKSKKIDLIGFAKFLVHLTKVVSLGLKEYITNSRVDLKEMHVVIGTDDAAQTALISGTVMQAANGLCALLQHISDFRCDNRNLSITPDFTSENSSVSFQLVVTNKLKDIIGIFFRTYTRFFEGKEDNHARNSIKTGH